MIENLGGTLDPDGGFASKVCSTIEDIACPTDGESKSCKCNVLKISETSRNRLRKLSRQLQPSNLLIEYELVIEAICSSADCSDIQTVANQLYQEVTGTLRVAINDGSVISALQTISSDLNTLLENATVSGDFSEVVVPILALLAKFYPDWSGQSNTCKNDGQGKLLAFFVLQNDNN